MTVVIPVLGARPSLALAVQSVLVQEYPGAFDVVVVASADREEDLARLADRPGLRLIHRRPALISAAARNAGVEVATGSLLAFTDDDAVAEPDWLRRLVERSAGSCAVAGSVVNGTPESRAGTVEYVLDRLDLYPGRPDTPVPWHGDTVNLLVPRSVWESFGPFPDHRSADHDPAIGGTDTSYTSRLRRAGVLAFAPAARVTHLNRTAWSDVLRGQYRRGRSAAYFGRSEMGHPGAWLLGRPVLAPLAAAGRLWSVFRRTRAWAPELMGRVIRLTPDLTLALAAWAAGLACEGSSLARRTPGPN